MTRRQREARSGRAAACDVVTLAAREPSVERESALLAAIGAEPDWEYALVMAAAHGVAPLLAATVHSAPWAGDISSLVRRRLHLIAAASAIANATAFTTLARLLETLAQRGIHPLVLKGPALARTLYSSPSLRPFGDFDLLCKTGELDAAGEALGALGYVRREATPTEPSDFHRVYLAGDGSLPVELHGDLLQLGLPARCRDALWLSPEVFRVGETDVHMLEVHYQILHLCVHLHTHGYGRLIWFKDLDLLIRRRSQDINWHKVYALARAEGAELSVRHALAHVRTLLDTPLPCEALCGPGGNRVGELAHAILWPRRRVLALESKQRLRSVRFNPRQGALGVVPSLLVMGRRRDKLARLLGELGERRATV